MKLSGKQLGRLIIFILIGLLVIAVPFTGNASILGLFTRIFILGLLAMSLDLLVGYAGLWSLGHAAFFGIGGYTTGILIVRYGITGFWLPTLGGILMAALVSCLFGFIALRVSAIYFLIITFALGQLVATVAIKWESMTGGTYGLSGIPFPAFCDSPTSFYYFVLVFSIICAVLLYFITKSPFGYSLQGIREGEIRMKCLGYNTWLHKYIAYIVAGAFAGAAGTMYAYFSGVITPFSLDVMQSGVLWLMIIVGGTCTLWGGLVGAGVILLLQYFVSSYMPERWPLILGCCLVIAILFAREGILPQVNRLLSRLS